ncbi:hypothetical protein [Cryobacterium sp. Sr8]|uniref:hypothetical protein n=1 Tax=Cryobacterium sp. Sr8 TaxID=1259203 RepID=UPI00141A985B|nr:hypothetical protein [Cryobacterium sp. Sr8]
MSHSSCCSPEPETDSVHQVCSSGGSGSLGPATSSYSARNGAKVICLSTVWFTPARYWSTSAWGAIPMKISPSCPTDVARSLIVPTSKGSPVDTPMSASE